MFATPFGSGHADVDLRKVEDLWMILFPDYPRYSEFDNILEAIVIAQAVPKFGEFVASCLTSQNEFQTRCEMLPLYVPQSFLMEE